KNLRPETTNRSSRISTKHSAISEKWHHANIVGISRSPLFDSELDKAPRAIKHLFVEQFELFSHDPDNSSLRVHQLRAPMASYYSFDVNSDWRVLFKIRPQGKGIHIVLDRIGPHSQLYRQ